MTDLLTQIELDELRKQIKNLEERVEKLEHLEKEEKIEEDNLLTPKEMEQLEHYSTLLEQHSNMFNYGRNVGEGKMAESL